MIESTKPEFNIAFHDDDGEVGCLYWDGELRFKGNADKTAKRFIEYFLKPNLEAEIEQECIKAGIHWLMKGYEIATQGGGYDEFEFELEQLQSKLKEK